MTSAKAIVTTVYREMGSLHKLNKDAENKLNALKLAALASNKKLTLERQLDAVNLGLKIFNCYENKHADMSETLVNLLQNSTLVYEWRTEMERIITQQIYSTKDTNIFMKAAVDPDVLEQTFLQEIKEIEEEDQEGVENLDKDNKEWSSN